MVTAKKSQVAKADAPKAPKTAVAKPVAPAKVAAKKIAAIAAPVAAPAPPPKAPPAKKSAKAKPKAVASHWQKIPMDAQQRHHYVEVAAFFIAEQRGFAPGNHIEDWKAAEAEVDRFIASGHFAG
jgi:hypothetical protein